jgi:predicted metalloendopeptidase
MQAGLGLPDKSYHVDADKKDKLEAYERHVAKVLALPGIPAPDADARGPAGGGMETRLAKVSKSREEILRDVSSGLRTSRESYLENVLAAAEFNYRYGLSKVGKCGPRRAGPIRWWRE